MSVNSRLTVISIIGPWKEFYRQRSAESSCARKETADIDIFVTSTNGDRKIIKSTRITTRPPSIITKWNQFNQFRWTSTKVIPIFFFFFLIGIHSMQGWTATTRHGVTRKEAEKRLQDTENLFRKNLQLKDVC